MNKLLVLSFCLYFIGCTLSPTIPDKSGERKPDLSKLLIALGDQPKQKPKIDKIGQCYEAGDSVEFRIVQSVQRLPDPKRAFSELTDLNGKKYLSRPIPVISKNDVDYICLKKEADKIIEGGSVSGIKFSFKQTSWGEVFERTKNADQTSVALIKNSKIIVVATLVSSNVSKGFDLTLIKDPEFQFLINDLKAVDQPNFNQIETDYLAWLERQVQKYPDNIELLSELVDLYLTSNIEDCSRIFNTYRKASLNNLTSLPVLMKLRNCYLSSMQYDAAVTTFDEILNSHINQPVEPRRNWYKQLYEAYIRCFLGDAHLLIGNSQKAIDEFEKSLILIETANPISPWMDEPSVSDFIQTRIQKEKRKEQQLIKAMIHKVSSTL